MENEKPNIVGDRFNVILLTYLFVLQNIPRGIADAVSLMLQKRNISYADQAEFSLISYSLCLKLLWAPIVDCVYSKRIGRRKTWTVVTQYFIGIFLFYISINLDDWLGSEDGTRKPKTRLLAIVFFLCISVAATEGIAVGGWSLTMLKKRNVGHSGTCDNSGFAISQFLSFVLFIVLGSKDFCNVFRSVPQDYGFITFSEFVLVWSAVYMVTSTVILIFKREESVEDDNDYKLGLRDSYLYLWRIVKVTPVLQFCLILFTFQMGQGPMNGVARLKLIDAGVSSDIFALLTVPALPFQIIVPFVLSRFLIGHRAMRTFIFTYFLKIIFGIVYGAFVFVTPLVKDENNELPNWHYWLLMFIYNAINFVEHMMFVALGAFCSRISDPRFGGMYGTLFAAVSGAGYRWPVSGSLWLVDLLTIKSCVVDEVKGATQCVTILDGFVIETIIGTVISILWLWWAKKKIYKLEDLNSSEWIVSVDKAILVK